jgi:hypothetical protein
VVIAARGESYIYLLTNDGKGNFAPAKAINVGGPITAVAAGGFGQRGVYSKLLVGINDQTGSHLMVYTGALNGLGGLTVRRLPGAASSIQFGELGDIGPDVFIAAGGKVLILHSPSLQLETLSLPVNAASIALGSFIYDRNPQLQIAVLGTDGSVQIVAHEEFDSHLRTPEETQAIRHALLRGTANQTIRRRVIPANGWRVVETFTGVAPFNSTQPPVLMRTRISDNAADDIMVLNGASGHMAVIEHPDLAPGAVAFVPGVISIRSYEGSPVAAISTRVNVDGRPGVVAVHQGQVAPAVMMPLPDPTFFPNEFDDPAVPVDGSGNPLIANFCNNFSTSDTSSACSLREAIIKANLTAGPDTVQLASGTYQLSIPRVEGDWTSKFGALYINDSVNIVGAGQNSTVIQAGTTDPTTTPGTSGNGVDFVMAVNEDLGTANRPVTNATASISALTLKFGKNGGNFNNFDGDGGCMEFDTGSSGTANLSLTNVTLANCSTTDGNGGGIAIFNASSGVTGGSGQATISNSIIENNTAHGSSGRVGNGAGIWVADLARMDMNSSQVLSNKATQVVGAGTAVAAASGSSQPVLDRGRRRSMALRFRAINLRGWAAVHGGE